MLSIFFSGLCSNKSTHILANNALQAVEASACRQSLGPRPMHFILEDKLACIVNSPDAEVYATILDSNDLSDKESV